MDQLSSLKKSFKHTTKKVSVANDIENLPILAHQSPEPPSASSSVNSASLTTRSSIDLNDRHEVIVKIDGGDQKTNGNERNMLWHEPSYEFWREDSNSGPNINSPRAFQLGNKDVPEDPPSRLIGQFLNKQRAVGCEMALDMDLEMEELKNHTPKPENDSSTAGSSPLNFPGGLEVLLARRRSFEDIESCGRITWSAEQQSPKWHHVASQSLAVQKQFMVIVSYFRNICPSLLYLL